MARQQQRGVESIVGFCEFIALLYTGAKQSWIAFGMICVLCLIIWWAFFRKSTCDVANSSSGRPCADIAYGCLRACYRPAHKRAKRRALLALLVPGNGAVGASGSPRNLTAVGGTLPQPPQVTRPIYDLTMLLVTFAGSAASVLAIFLAK